MSTIINLRQVRKQKARAEKDAAAEANRIKHGVGKRAHKDAKAEAEQGLKKLDGHKLDQE